MEAKQGFANDKDVSYTTFTTIAEQNHGDPIVPHALLYAGMAAVKEKKYQEASKSLRQLTSMKTDRALLIRGHLYLGIAMNYQGESELARFHLKEGKDGISSEEEKGEWLAAMAISHGVNEFKHWDRFYQAGSPSERKFIADSLRTHCQTLSVSQLESWRSNSEGIANAIATEQLSKRDPNNTSLRSAVESLQGKFQVYASQEKTGPVKVAAVVPTSGRTVGFGRKAIQGMMLASDSQPGLVFSVQGAGDVASFKGADVVVGPLATSTLNSWSGSVKAVLSLVPRPERAIAENRFHMIHSAEQRTRILAKHAVSRGIKNFAVFYPDDGYGRAMARVFDKEVSDLGGVVISTVKYPSKTTSFTNPIKSLKGPFNAVFVPDRADRLKLIAPALAAGNLRVRAVEDTQKVRFGRKIVLLSTAEFLDSSFVSSSGRYTAGAILAPGFYPDVAQPAIGAFVAAFRAKFARSPAPIEAYAYDAAMVASKSKGSTDLLKSNSWSGVTGDVSFDSRGLRQDQGWLYTVRKVENGDLGIRVLNNK